MKRLNLSQLFMLMILALAVAAGCTKEGPAGPAGADGTNGTNGTDGADGTTTCVECHSDNQVLYTREAQWAQSVHATGHAFGRNSGECAVCHTSQGFLGDLDGTYDWTAEGANIPNPNPQNCYTCHSIHDTYTTADLALTVSGPVELRNTGTTYDFGTGGLCASCHQGRTVDPFPVAGGADIVVTSSRYGVHHGPMANTISGLGLFNVGTGYINSAHATITNTCVTCHMADGYGYDNGGHTFFMAFEGGDINTTGCLDCHTADEAEALTEEFQAEIAALLAELKVKLDATGITNEGSDSSVPGTYPAVVAGACLNYKAITEDKSLGVHNPKYIKKLLQNTIAAF
jgi:hypothetical protein